MLVISKVYIENVHYECNKNKIIAQNIYLHLVINPTNRICIMFI